MNTYDAAHLRSLLAAANTAAHIDDETCHVVNRARERVALKVTEVKHGADDAREASNANMYYGQTETEWAYWVSEARRLLDEAARIEAKRLAAERRAAGADEKPFWVYTRLYKDHGDCEKLVHHCKTRAAQARFIATTHRAVTNFN